MTRWPTALPIWMAACCASHNFAPQVIDRALQREPQDRFPDVRVMRRELMCVCY
ncbi:MAG: hypothetical protein L0Z62_00025 [Gemmataceae bacterium]|nr:hypothetical protein [Gemmataceae bacterium]